MSAFLMKHWYPAALICLGSLALGMELGWKWGVVAFVGYTLFAFWLNWWVQQHLGKQK